YIRAVRDNLPRAVHVFDHFHVIKLFNEKLSAFRRQLYLELTTAHDRKVLKGTRWLLLKNPENLDPSRDEQQRLEEALRLNEPLATAYYLKEDLRQIWDQPNKRIARRVLQDWLKRARLGPTHARPVRRHPRRTSGGHLELLPLSDLHRTPGGHQHQNPTHETPSLRLSRSGVLQTENPGHP